MDETLVCDHSSESYWAVLSCGTVYYTVQGGCNFKSVNETLVCDHSNESYWAVRSCCAVYYVVQYINVVVTFKSVGETLIVILTSYSVYF